MQLAERWLGIGSIVVAVAAAGAFAMRPHHRHHQIYVEQQHIPFQRTNCSGVAAQSEPIEVQLITNQPDPYEIEFAKADVVNCFTTTERVEMLIDIAPDGHVTRATHRPERPTKESRCIAKAVRDLHFPATGESIAIRYAFTHALHR